MSATVHGKNLMPSGGNLPPCSSAPTLDTSCNGVSVLVNGKPAPIIDGSPTQVVFEVPVDLAPPTAMVQALITPSMGQAAPSNVLTVPVAPTNPGFATDNYDGIVIGHLVTLAYVTLDPAVCVVIGNCTQITARAITPSSPAYPGETLSINGTGLGATIPSGVSGSLPPDGSTLANPVKVSVAGQTVSLIIHKDRRG